MSSSIVREALETSVTCVAAVSLQTSHESIVPNARSPRGRPRRASSHSSFVAEKYGSGTRPVRSRMSSARQLTAARGRPPVLPHDRAARSAPAAAVPDERRLALVRDPDRSELAGPDACVGQRLAADASTTVCQISSASCSTQPGCGKVLAELLVPASDSPQRFVDDETCSAGRPLVDREEQQAILTAAILREDDYRVVSADDAVPMPVEYRLNVTRQPLAWAKQYVFEAVALVGVVITQVDIWTNLDDNRTRLSAIALVTAGALVFRRRAPFVAPLVVAAGAIVFSLLDPSAAYTTDTMFLPLLLAAWAAGALLDWRLAVTALGALLVAGWTVFIRAPDVPWTELIWLSFPLVGIFVISAAAARHSEQAREAEERALRNRGGGTASRRGRADPDRPRAARRRSRTRQRDGRPGRAPSAGCSKPEQQREREALIDGRGDGPRGAREMRRLLGDAAHRGRGARARAAAGPRRRSTTLVEQVREAGLPVELAVEGEPVDAPGRRRPLRLPDRAGGADQRAQARRPGARAASLVRYGGDGSSSRWRTTARGHGADAGGGGHGLVGMRERVALYGGELRRRPDGPGGGFRVAARLPADRIARMTVRVLIVDDQALVRAGFRMILEAEPDIEVVGEAERRRGGRRRGRATLTPDVVLMDIRMPELDGLEATRRILAATEPTLRACSILTTFDLDEYVFEALRAGASGFLLKDAPPEQLVAGDPRRRRAATRCSRRRSRAA